MIAILMARAAGLLLAAGAGRRLGLPKALLRLDGRLLVERAAGILSEGGCDPVVVVLGAMAQRVREEADLRAATVVVNAEWESGMGSSLKAGLRALGQTGADAAVVILVDLPGLTPAAVRRLADLASPQALGSATYQGTRGHPVLLGRSHWEGIAALPLGDGGARDYLQTHEVHLVACEDVAGNADIDTRDDALAWGIRG
jgi:CTP:molybdopterin cytidylyltransferase MocA